MGKVTFQTRIIMGAIAFVVALAALVTAANTDDATFHTGGLVVGALGFAVCWLLMKIHFDRWERDPNRPRRPAPRPPADPDEPAEMTPPPPVPPQTVSYSLPARETRHQALDPQTHTWIRGAIIGLIGLIGLIVAASGTGFGYWGGLLVFALAVLSLFRMIGQSFDGEPHGEPQGRSGLPVPPAGPLRWIAGVVAGLVGLIALFIAAGGGASYYLGILAAIAAVAYVFYVMKTGFDEAERH